MKRSAIEFLPLLVVAIFGALALAPPSPARAEDEQSKPITDVISDDLKCPADLPACKDEGCHFENRMEVTVVDKKISAVTAKWKKSSTSQCCKPNRDFRAGSLTFTYDDGSSVDVTPGSYVDPSKPWPPGVTWTNADGTEATAIPAPPAGTPAPPPPAGHFDNGAPREPAGFTFDPKKAGGKGLTIVKIDYNMTLSCTCIGSTDAATKTAKKAWPTFTVFNLETKKFTHPGH
jgi:hypothetical protein